MINFVCVGRANQYDSGLVKYPQIFSLVNKYSTRPMLSSDISTADFSDTRYNGTSDIIIIAVEINNIQRGAIFGKNWYVYPVFLPS